MTYKTPNPEKIAGNQLLYSNYFKELLFNSQDYYLEEDDFFKFLNIIQDTDEYTDYILCGISLRFGFLTPSNLQILSDHPFLEDAILDFNTNIFFIQNDLSYELSLISDIQKHILQSRLTTPTNSIKKIKVLPKPNQQLSKVNIQKIIPNSLLSDDKKNNAPSQLFLIFVTNSIPLQHSSIFP